MIQIISKNVTLQQGFEYIKKWAKNSSAIRLHTADDIKLYTELNDFNC
jgi:hypothetical protein